MKIDNRIFATIVAGPVVGLAVKYAGAFLCFALGLSADWYGLSMLGAAMGILAWIASPVLLWCGGPFLGHTHIGGSKE